MEVTRNQNATINEKKKEIQKSHLFQSRGHVNKNKDKISRDKNCIKET